ncbi:hypothetical protein FA15DRAFT_662209, partial [Coprinopsis marcescibilis]
MVNGTQSKHARRTWESWGICGLVLFVAEFAVLGCTLVKCALVVFVPASVALLVTAQLSISTHAPPSMVSKSKARAKSSSASSVSSVRTSKSQAGSTRVKAEPSDGHKMPRASGKTKGDEMTTLCGSVHLKLVPWFGAAGISI